MVAASLWSRRHADVLDGRTLAELGHRRHRPRDPGHRSCASPAWRTCRSARRARAILLVKHQSTLETFLMPTLMPHPLAYVFKKELIYVPVLRLGDGAAGHDPHRPQPARAGLQQGRRAGQARCWRRASGSSCSPRARAFRAGRRAPTRPAARGWPGDRRAGDADRRHFGQGLAAQGLHQAARRGRRVDRQADPERRAASPTN